MTAAHCTVDRLPGNIFVLVGSIYLTGGISYKTNKFINHPSFIKITLANDISLIQTYNTITFTVYVKSIFLGDNQIAGGVSAKATGWGKTSVSFIYWIFINLIKKFKLQEISSTIDTLQFVDTSTLTNTNCLTYLPVLDGRVIYSYILCSLTKAGQGICLGNGGSPLTYAGTVIGITSWASKCNGGNPDGYTRVSYFRKFILYYI